MPLVSAQLEQLEVSQKPENYNEYSSLELNININSEIEIIPEKNSYSIDYMNVVLKYFPDEDERQKIISEKIIAEGADIENRDNKIYFSWEDPKEKRYYYSIDADIKTKNDFIKITKKVPFPIRFEDKSLERYIKPTEFIDINSDIKDLAVELVEGEDDMYIAVTKIADWINNNVEYDLTTLTAEAVQKSSWVLENKQGVCDEITNLFISMLRSLNIPARFVGGVVYTNAGYYFGNHGWAEVYFPGYGWVPFDVTFGQYGWIDPSHVKLSVVEDSGESAVDYTWRSSGIELKPKGLSITTDVKKTIGQIYPLTTLSLKPFEKEASFGSYVPLEVTIKNNQPYYVPESIVITKAPNLLEKNVKHILLKPNEEKKFFWTIVIDKDLNEKFVYTSELEAKTTFGAVANDIIKFSKDFNELSLEKAEETIKSMEIREEKKFLSNIDLMCGSSKKDYYTDEEIDIKCVVENTGNKNIENIDVCVITNCKRANLKIAEKKELDFKISLSSPIDLRISAETDSLIKYNDLKLNIVKVPKVRFIEIEPKTIEYREKTDLTFDIFSNTMINNVSLEVSGIAKSQLENFEGRYSISAPLQGKNIRNNELKIKLFYRDELGLDRKHEEIHKIEVTNIPFYRTWIDKIFSFFQ
ncbi:transglutaminase domain-containing protein [Candidatus Woesearchaeota archaeon]|nr:transglutaminase domain-containing protein [Candidatus Woesearchaeota archaeon]